MSTYDCQEKNDALCRKDLDWMTSADMPSPPQGDSLQLRFFRVFGVCEFWDKTSLSSLVSDLLTSCHRFQVALGFALVGDAQGISLYIGTKQSMVENLMCSTRSMFPGIDLALEETNPMETAPCEFGGIFHGVPTEKSTGESKNFQIENICRGMSGKEFTYLILATGMNHLAVNCGHTRVLEEMEESFSRINQSIAGGIQGNLTMQQQKFTEKHYFENLEFLEQTLYTGMRKGMWAVSGYFASDNLQDSKLLGNIIKASYGGDSSKPEPFRVMEYKDIQSLIRHTAVFGNLSPHPEIHPLGRWQDKTSQQGINLYVYQYQSILNSDQLATLCRLPEKEFFGYYIDQYVEFDLSDRVGMGMKHPLALGQICTTGRQKNQQHQNLYRLEKNDLTRHALILGITGGGKTNTTKSMLSTLWTEEKVPFLVIESAKREYWELRNLKGFEDLLVFTLGDESASHSVKYRINPFETNPHISLQTHIDYLLATFKAAFDLFAPLPFILEKAVYEIYQDLGWDIVENRNIYGLQNYPTLGDLYHKVGYLIEHMGYNEELQSNLKTALEARINSLMIGGKGAMLNTSKSIPIEKLLQNPVVLELEDLGDDETKSFVIGILLVQLYEYRKSQMTQGSKELSHILMVEEAHRLLKKVPEGSGEGTRGKSVEFFCNLLAEIRTFGQGILIADQIPTKLAPDTIKNTNLKIVHRMVAEEDREAVGKAMNMTAEQIAYLSSLQRGFAAVYAEGDNRPKCVKFPLIESYYDKDRRTVIEEMREKLRSMVGDYEKNVQFHRGCSFCPCTCDRIPDDLLQLKTSIDLKKLLLKFQEEGFLLESMAHFLQSPIVTNLGRNSPLEKFCTLGYLLEQGQVIGEGAQQRVMADYLKFISTEKQ